MKTRKHAVIVGLVVAMSVAGCATSSGAGAPGSSPDLVFDGPQTTAPHRRYPTALTFPEPYARTWDATAAVLASRGIPMQVAARDSGVMTTGWVETQPHHRAMVRGKAFVGRKVERLILLIRPVSGGTELSIASQSALVSPQWSVAGMPPAGQAVDIPSDTVTEYGVLHDVARVLRHPLTTPPDSSYGLGLAKGGVFGRSAMVGSPPQAVEQLLPPPPLPTVGGGEDSP